MHPNVSLLSMWRRERRMRARITRRWPRHFRRHRRPPGLVFDGDEGRLSEAAFLRDFAGDLPEAKAKVLYAVQEPFHKALLSARRRIGLAVEPSFYAVFDGRPDDQSDLDASWPSAWAPRPSK